MMNIKEYNFDDIIEDPRKRLILIIYDIIETKRRNKMVKLLESYGIRVQKSAFEALLDYGRYSELLLLIPKIIDNDDNVRIYRLNSSNEVKLYGESDTIYVDEVVVV